MRNYGRDLRNENQKKNCGITTLILQLLPQHHLASRVSDDKKLVGDLDVVFVVSEGVDYLTL